MGTIVSITVVEDAGISAAATIDAAFTEIDRIEHLMSTYDSESELSVLNRDGSIEASAELIEVARAAIETHAQSAGAFDATIFPLLELYRSSFEDHGRPPSPAEVQAALEFVDTNRIELEGARISLPAGMAMTLDGIAKGYAIDRAIETLRSQGVRGALVNAGGDVRVLGSKGDAPWNVALQNPRNAREYLAQVPLEDHALATSGDYRRYFDPERKVHHILDPRDGQSARGLISVSVTAETAMRADALATAVFVLGVEEGTELVERLDGVEALLVTEERLVINSSGWSDRVE